MSDSSYTQETTIDSQISKPPEQNNPVNAKAVRRVCFSQLPPKHEDKKKPRNKLKRSDDCRPGSDCCLCCAWTCLVIFALFLLLLLFGTLFFAFLRSELPEIRLQKMSFPELDIIVPSSSSSSSSQKTLLSADVDLLIEVSNKNQKVGLSYGTMTVNLWSEKIKLGQTQVVGFFQDPKNVTLIKVHTSVTKSQVEKEEGSLLKSNFKDKKLVLDVILYGNLGFNVGALKINGLPVMVECMKIEQSMVDVGQYHPKCSFKMMVFRAMFNAVNGG